MSDAWWKALPPCGVVPVVRYQIVVRGRFGTALIGPLEGAVAKAAGERTNLTIDIVDQAHLQGVLRLLHDRGIEVISVNPIDSGAA
jgi:hypothetical protein